MVYMDEMKMTGEAIKELNITKVTLFGWIRNGIIQAEKTGSGGYYLFSDEEIERIKRFIPKARKRGLQVITPQIIEAIRKDRNKSH